LRLHWAPWRGTSEEGKRTTPSTALVARHYTDPNTGTPLAFTFREDGWFNMTKAAQAFGKQLQHFWKSPETQEYLTACAEVSSSKSDDLLLFEAIPGNRYVPDRGTWAHPDLAVFFARWLSVRFARWCDLQIRDILQGKAPQVVPQTAPPEVPSTADLVKLLQNTLEQAAEDRRLFLETIQEQAKLIKSQQAAEHRREQAASVVPRPALPAPSSQPIKVVGTCPEHLRPTPE
jgi:KilA-N domain